VTSTLIKKPTETEQNEETFGKDDSSS